MTRRDWFAALAMHSLISKHGNPATVSGQRRLADAAYSIAGAMMTEMVSRNDYNDCHESELADIARATEAIAGAVEAGAREVSNAIEKQAAQVTGRMLAQLGYVFEREGERLIIADPSAAVEYERMQTIAETLFGRAVDAGFDGGLNEAFGDEESA